MSGTAVQAGRTSPATARGSDSTASPASGTVKSYPPGVLELRVVDGPETAEVQLVSSWGHTNS